MKHTLKASVAAIAALTALGSNAIAEDRVVKVYNWSDYIAEDTLEKFTAATGIKVIYDVFDSNEVLEAKVLSGQSGYDVVVPTSDFMARQIVAGAYQKLDKSKIPNFKNLDPKIMEAMDIYDKGAQYSAPYQWGTTGIGYNINKVAEIMGEDYEVNSWELVFNPEIVAKLSACGVTMLDAPTEMYPHALQYMGLSPYTSDKKDFDKASELLTSVRGDIRYFHSSKQISDLANGDICVAVGWSGDMFQAMARAEEAENGVEIGYTIPKEGALSWSDMMVIPADSQNVDEAHEYINFILNAQIGADITNYVWYGSPNLASQEFIDQEILDDPGIFPAEDVILLSNVLRSKKVLRMMTRGWTKVKSGR